MKTLFKDIAREIKNTFAKFLSIMVMTALGVFVLVGLKVTGPAMRETTTRHVKAQNMYDIFVSSPAGIDDEDIAILKDTEGIDIGEAGYFTEVHWIDRKLNTRLEGLSESISVPEVVEGSLPSSPDEIAIEKLDLTDGVNIGDVIEFAHESDKFKTDKDKLDLKRYTYKVVGKVISTDYVLRSAKGQSTVNGLNINTVGYILPENFIKEDFSFYKLILTGTKGLDPEGKSYKSIADQAKHEIKRKLEPRLSIKFDKLKATGYKKLDEANRKILNAHAKLDDAQKKLDDVKKKLNDAKKELDDGEAEITKNEKKLSDAKKDGEKKISDAKTELADGIKKLNDAKKELDKNETELADGIKKLADGKEEYLSSKRKLDEAEESITGPLRQLNEIEEALKANAGELELAKTKRYELSEQIIQMEEQLTGIKIQLSGVPEGTPMYEELSANISTLEMGIAQANAGIVEIDEKLRQADSLKAMLSNKAKLEEALSEVQKGRAKLKTAYDEIESNEKKLADAREKLVNAKRKIEDEEKKISDAERELKTSEDKFNREISDAEAKLVDARRKYNDGKKKYEDGLSEYNEKNDEFITKKTEVIDELKDGEKKVADSKELLERLKQPKFTVGSRSDNDFLFGTYDAGYKLDTISWIFPLFFFFIAILVSVTTMTRMIEEHRLQIGTYKALGYGTLDVLKKYLIYGGASSLIGGIAGAIAGSSVLPKIIFNAYSTSFMFKELLAQPDASINITAILIGVAACIIATLAVVLGTLRENAANLLRPKAPKKAKKILLERVGFIWKRLKFLDKVTMRNVFRYKSRMFMTIFGIAGCTGLLFLGFSLREAIGGIKPLQFEEIMRYDFSITTDEALGDAGREKYLSFLSSDKVDDYIDVLFENLTTTDKKGRDQNVTIAVTDNPERFGNFIQLIYDRPFKSRIILSAEAPTVSTKLADITGGDVLKVTNGDFEEFDIEYKDKSDFYLGHFVFMNSESYKKIFGKEFKPNSYLIKVKDKTKLEEYKEDLRLNESILSVSDFAETEVTIDDWSASIGIVTIIILVCSAMLAFVVLFNLSNINIEERMRELSTIKVLGFHNLELTHYIYRETYMLSAMGIAVGYVLGWGLLIAICELLPPENMMMNLNISYLPYLLSAAISMFFTFVVRFSVAKRLRKINMVEALKSYE